MDKLIAIVGMAGSGKSVATDYLEKHGFSKIYFGGITYKLMKEANIEVTPDGKSEKEFREKLRREHGMECYAKFLLPDIEKALKESDVVLDGLYSWDEYKFLMDKCSVKLKLVCVIADKNIRYARIATRDNRPLSRDAVIFRDISEIENLAKGGPIAYADYYIYNNGSLNDYEMRLLEILDDIKQEGEK